MSVLYVKNKLYSDFLRIDPSINIKNMLLIFLVALLLRIIYAWFFVDVENLIHEDQEFYIYLGQTIAKTGEFVQHTNGGNIPVTERVPGYPIFLSIIYSLFGENNMAVVLVQIIIDSLTCVVIGLLSGLVMRHGFLIAGIVSALNLNMIILSGMILTDTLFLFFFSLFILFSFFYLRKAKKMQLFLSITFLSIATLVRPVSYFLIVLLLLLLIIRFVLKKSSLKEVIQSLFVYLIPIVIVLGSVHHRNYHEYNSYSLVSQGGMHTLNWVVPAVYQYSGQGSYQEGKNFAKSALEQSMVRDKIKTLPDNPFESSSYRMKVAKEALLELGLLNIVHAWTGGTLINLVSPSVAYAPIVRKMDHPSFYATTGNGVFEKLINYINNTNGLTYLSIIAIGSLFSIMFLFISLIGLYKLVLSLQFNKNNRVIILLSVLVIVYFFAITGPIVGVKYRLPIEPIMTLFFSYVLINFIKKYKFKFLEKKCSLD